MPNVPKPINSPAGALTVKQDAFIDAFIANGGKKEAAAIEAGYSKKSASVEAHRTLQKDIILSEIYRRCQNALAISAPAALHQLISLTSGARSERIRMECAQDTLDRVGFKPPETNDKRSLGDISVTINLGGIEGTE